MLVDENRVTIRIEYHHAGRTAGGFIRFSYRSDSAGLQRPLDLPYIVEIVKRLGLLSPPWVERERVALKHSLKESDHAIAVAEDEPVLSLVSSGLLKSEFLVECARCREIFDSQGN